MSPKKHEEEAPELLTWDPSDGTEEDEEVDDELPADEGFEGDEAFDEDGEEEAPLAAKGAEKSDGFSKEKQAALPQPDRARSHPDLPKVTTSSFKRLIR